MQPGREPVPRGATDGRPPRRGGVSTKPHRWPRPRPSAAGLPSSSRPGQHDGGAAPLMHLVEEKAAERGLVRQDVGRHRTETGSATGDGGHVDEAHPGQSSSMDAESRRAGARWPPLPSRRELGGPPPPLRRRLQDPRGMARITAAAALPDGLRLTGWQEHPAQQICSGFLSFSRRPPPPRWAADAY